MPLIAFDYRFTVTLPASADVAYRWATDYAPDDPDRMGQVGRRRIERLADRTIMLTDAIRRDGRLVSKTRLVRLRPKERSWTNTHYVGPTRYSQFLYRIVPAGRNRSRLEFTGLQVEPSPRPLTAAELAKRASVVRREDATLWRHLVRAMRADLGRPRRRTPRRRSG